MQPQISNSRNFKYRWRIVEEEVLHLIFLTGCGAFVTLFRLVCVADISSGRSGRNVSEPDASLPSCGRLFHASHTFSIN